MTAMLLNCDSGSYLLTPGIWGGASWQLLSSKPSDAQLPLGVEKLMLPTVMQFPIGSERVWQNLPADHCLLLAEGYNGLSVHWEGEHWLLEVTDVSFEALNALLERMQLPRMRKLPQKISLGPWLLGQKPSVVRANFVLMGLLVAVVGFPLLVEDLKMPTASTSDQTVAQLVEATPSALRTLAWDDWSLLASWVREQPKMQLNSITYRAQGGGYAWTISALWQTSEQTWQEWVAAVPSGLRLSVEKSPFESQTGASLRSFGAVVANPEMRVVLWRE
ncbi:MAG: hypothetical protein HWE20_09225 [Gammaproteobacteria bacterium]|nr:hypothetical protein [Gammaproteobacteria bacterium]